MRQRKNQRRRRAPAVEVAGFSGMRKAEIETVKHVVKQSDHYRPAYDRISHCIGCGCDEINACDGGCTWLRLDPKLARGVCSECPQHLERWDAGRRRFSPRASENIGLSMWPMGGGV